MKQHQTRLPLLAALAMAAALTACSRDADDRTAGERLDVTVLNLRVTGIRPRGGDPGAPRIVSSATPPEIKLSYVLYRQARPIAGGTEFITDPNFLDTQNPKFSSGQLYYEKRILSDWFAERFKYRRGLGRIVERQ